MTMITPSYLGETIEYSSLHACRSTLEDPTAAAQAVAQLSVRVKLPSKLREVGVPEADLETCAEGALSDGAIVYNGKFAAEKDLVLGVYKNAY